MITRDCIFSEENARFPEPQLHRNPYVVENQIPRQRSQITPSQR